MQHQTRNAVQKTWLNTKMVQLHNGWRLTTFKSSEAIRHLVVPDASSFTQSSPSLGEENAPTSSGNREIPYSSNS
jgi:hypothetical protein